MTHIIPCSARSVHNRYVALCGARVEGSQHARDGAPECPECARLDAEDEASILALTTATEESFGGPPVKATYGDPLAGYKVRGRR